MLSLPCLQILHPFFSRTYRQNTRPSWSCPTYVRTYVAVTHALSRVRGWLVGRITYVAYSLFTGSVGLYQSRLLFFCLLVLRRCSVPRYPGVPVMLLYVQQYHTGMLQRRAVSWLDLT